MWNASQQLIALQGKNLFSYRSVAGPSQKQLSDINIEEEIKSKMIYFSRCLAEIEKFLEEPPMERFTKKMDITKEENKKMRINKEEILSLYKERMDLYMSHVVKLLRFLNEEARKTIIDKLILEIEKITSNVIITPQEKNNWIHSLKQKFTAYVVEDLDSDQE